MLLVFELIAFLLGGMVVLVWLESDAVVLWLVLAVVFAAWRGFMQIDVGTNGVTIVRRGKTIETFAFADYSVGARRDANFVVGVVPLYTNRSIVMFDGAGKRQLRECRNFSERTFTHMMDDIDVHQRTHARATEQRPVALRTDEQSHAPKRLQRVVPMPGEADFVSIEFAINREQMIATERKRNRDVAIGLGICAMVFFALWMVFIYPDSGMMSRALVTGGFIAIAFVMLPATVMGVRFAQKRKRIPGCIRITSEQFAVDGTTFSRNEIPDFSLTPPGQEKVGNTSHRRHMAFTHHGVRHTYMIGSGMVKGAIFPDYSMLFRAVELQRAHIENGRVASIQTYGMVRTVLRLSRFTVATIEVPERREVTEIAGVISQNDAAVASDAEKVMVDPYRFAKVHADEYRSRGIADTSQLFVDALGDVGIPMVLENHHYAMRLGDLDSAEVLIQLQSIVDRRDLPVDVAALSHSVDDDPTLMLQALARVG